ncbi:MAG: MotA/TolQ/ExbB proton channel family protein [Myxococcota bacterium]
MDGAVEVYLAATAASGHLSVGSIVADVIVVLALILLVGMSLVSWAIIFQKFLRVRSASRQSARFLDLFWASKRLDAVYEKCGSYRGSPVAEVFRAGYQELAKITAAGGGEGKRADATENLERTLRRATSVESTNLERYVTFLGTTGSTAPFIGLFGTVVGILSAFNKLGQGGAATIDVVGPDIAFALIATAVGLAAAIPAVIAYNYFNSGIRVLNTEMDNFSADFLNIVKRHLH